MGKEPASRERPQQYKPPSFAAAHLAALMESTQDLIWSVDLNYRLVSFNKASSEAFARGFEGCQDRRRNESARSASTREGGILSSPL